MAALLEGTLIVEQGYLRVIDAYGGNHLIIWQADYFLNNRAGVLEILDGEGTAVARVGEAIRMGGGESRPEAFERNLREPLPSVCPGPYWLMGDIESLEAQAIPDLYVDPLPGGVYYAQSRPAPDKGLLTGTLAFDDQGCLRVGGYAVLWPPGVYWRDDNRPLRFVQIEDEITITVAELGAEVRLRGAARFPGDYRYFENKVYCAGPYWGVALVEQAQ
jgi:hypothetical protein